METINAHIIEEIEQNAKRARKLNHSLTRPGDPLTDETRINQQMMEQLLREGGMVRQTGPTAEDPFGRNEFTPQEQWADPLATTAIDHEQIERMRRDMINSYKSPEPSLHDLLIRNLSRKAMDIIGETGEQYELNIAEALEFIIDMYRQFGKRGENKTISDINVELSKMKEDVNGHESDVEKHKQGVKRFRDEEEIRPPF